MVRYEAPDELPVELIDLATLPADWRHQEGLTQGLGDRWHARAATPLLQVPSAIVPLARSPDFNILVSHSHASSAEIKIAEVIDFALDLRLL